MRGAEIVFGVCLLTVDVHRRLTISMFCSNMDIHSIDIEAVKTNATENCQALVGRISLTDSAKQFAKGINRFTVRRPPESTYSIAALEMQSDDVADAAMSPANIN